MLGGGGGDPGTRIDSDEVPGIGVEGLIVDGEAHDATEDDVELLVAQTALVGLLVRLDHQVPGRVTDIYARPKSAETEHAVNRARRQTGFQEPDRARRRSSPDRHGDPSSVLTHRLPARVHGDFDPTDARETIMTTSHAMSRFA